MSNLSMQRWKWLPLIALPLVFTACSPNPVAPAEWPAEAGQAEQSLRTYLQDLAEARYAEAVARYAGSYAELEGYNPDLDPADRAGLFERYCTRNGGMCLLPGSISLVEADAGTFTFEVTFLGSGGELFVLEGCCGEESAVPVSAFPYTVMETEAGLQVLGLPPYVP